MMKRSRSQADATASGNNGEPQYRVNAQKDAAIDEYIKNNPKYWAYVQSLPRDRLERALVLTQVQKEQRTERVNQAVLKQLDNKPELKQAYETLVKDLPEDQRERAMANIARQTLSQIQPKKQQQSEVSRGVTV